MASSPTPFFPTTVIPSSQYGFGAPALGVFPTPVADPPPFPCFWSAPYAYPYTAACPAPAYGPSSFGPVAASSQAAQPAPNQEHFRPSWCSSSHPIPLTTTAPNQEHQPPHPPITIPTPGYYYSTFPYDSSCQMREASQIPTHVDPNWSPAAPTLVHGDHHSSPECHAAARVSSSAAPLPELPDVHPVLPTAGFPYVPPNPAPPESTAAAVRPVTALPHRPDQAPGAPLPTDLSRPTPELLDTIQTAPDRERCTYQPLGSGPTHLKDFALQLKVAHRSLLDISRQLDEYQAQSKRSFASLQSGIARLVDMVPSSKSSTTTARTQSVGFKPSSASIALAESTTPVLSNIGAAEISPASSSSASFGGSFDVPKPASALTVPTAPAAPQVLDEMLECYSLHNLNRHSLFRADGTENKYFTLPADYPLERDVPKPLFAISDDESDGCSIESVQVFAISDEESDGGCNESVHVFADTEQHSHEEEKQETEQLLRCFSKQQDDERECNCPVLKAYNSDVTRSTQLCTAPSVTELRLLWDPGALHMHSGITINSTRTTTDTEWSKFSSPTSCELPQSASVQWSILSAQHFLDSTMKKGSIFSAGRPLPWDQWSAILLLHHCLWEFSIRPATRLKWNPGVPEILHSYTAIHSTEVDVQQLRDLPLKVLVTHESRKEWDPGDSTVLSSALKRAIVVVLKTLMLTTSGIFTLPYVLTVRVQFGMPTCVTQQSCYGRVLYIQENYGIQFLWDPGILRWWTISAQHILESGGIFSTERILPWNQWILDALLHVQYYCLLIVLGCLYPEPVQQLVCSSSLFSSTAMSMLTATTVGMRLVLGSGKIAQEEKYVAVMYQLLKTQIQMSKTSHIWDPGIKFIFYELWWLSQKTGYVLRHLLAVKFGTHNYTYFIGTAASMCWPPANSVQQRRNIAALLPFHQCILLSSAVCPWDPGIAFVYQQGVHENCNAMNQLPTEICLQIWRMNIIFITFLPP